ncbi:MAG: methyltransferase domain-containing protein [Bacteroidetes bacterium]|nr:methyltransferase domain-containing protein [Bacteroidota bacterium]
MRKKRFALLETQIEALIARKGKIKILDIGGEKRYWENIGWQNPNCTIYLLNLDMADNAENSPGFVTVKGNALSLPYQAGDFDLIFSNSVIEHVGSYGNQELFAAEVKRVCDHYIIQTPSFWFPLEPHSLLPFFQFIPHALRAYLIMWFHINYFPKASNYRDALQVSRSTIMFTKKRFQKLFPDAECQVERLFGLPKSYTVVKL